MAGALDDELYAKDSLGKAWEPDQFRDSVAMARCAAGATARARCPYDNTVLDEEGKPCTAQVDHVVQIDTVLLLFKAAVAAVPRHVPAGFNARVPVELRQVVYDSLNAHTNLERVSLESHKAKTFFFSTKLLPLLRKALASAATTMPTILALAVDFCARRPTRAASTQPRALPTQRALTCWRMAHYHLAMDMFLKAQLLLYADKDMHAAHRDVHLATFEFVATRLSAIAADVTGRPLRLVRLPDLARARNAAADEVLDMTRKMEAELAEEDEKRMAEEEKRMAEAAEAMQEAIGEDDGGYDGGKEAK